MQYGHVVRRGFGRTTDGTGALNKVRMQGSLVIGLLTAHRESGREFDATDIELLFEQTTLCDDVVVRCDQRKLQAGMRFCGIARRRGIAIGKHIRDDDEILFWVQGISRCNIGCHPVVRARFLFVIIVSSLDER